jgi:hypothetical protein
MGYDDDDDDDDDGYDDENRSLARTLAFMHRLHRLQSLPTNQNDDKKKTKERCPQKT